MSMRLTLLAPLAAAALVPTSAFAVDYLNVEQAQKLMFAQADEFVPREITLDVEQMRQLESATGLRARSARWQLLQARRAGQPIGWLVIDNVVGKYELITYAVALSPEASVLQVEILSYRESHGHEIRSAAWRKQFEGKTAQSPLRVGDDIANISGATLSTSHVSEGVRRIVALVHLTQRPAERARL